MIHSNSPEWLDYNMSRAYPLDDSTGGVAGTIPCDAFVDCHLITEGIGDADIYISSIKSTGTAAVISLATTSNIEFTDCLYIAFSTESRTPIDVYAESGEAFIHGKITTGNVLALSTLPAVSTYTPEQTKLFKGLIIPVDGLFIRGIRVGDTLLTGDIVIEAGDGIFLSVEGNTIKISAIAYELPEDNKDITSDDDIINAVVDSYGTPITSINGVEPDESGDISVVEPAEQDTNSDYAVVESTDADGVLLLKLSRDPALAKNTIEALANNYSQLDIRAGTIIESINSLDGALNTLSSQLTRLS